MNLAKVINNVIVRYPYSLTDLLNDNPDSSLESIEELTTDMLPEFGLVDVMDTEKPNYDESICILKEYTPVLNNGGQWEKSWKAIPNSTVSINNVKVLIIVRDYYLKCTDRYIYKAAEIGHTLSDEFIAYRQFLRDVTDDPNLANIPKHKLYPDFPEMELWGEFVKPIPKGYVAIEMRNARERKFGQLAPAVLDQSSEYL